MKKNKKINQSKIAFYKYQNHCYQVLMNMPPEFILVYIFLNVIFKHTPLMDEGKEDLLRHLKDLFGKMPDDLEQAIECLTYKRDKKEQKKFEKTLKKSLLH
jgi:hypothetical protein